MTQLLLFRFYSVREILYPLEKFPLKIREFVLGFVGTDFLYEADDAAPGISGFGGIKKARAEALKTMEEEAEDWTEYLSKSAADKKFTPPPAAGGPGSPVEIVFSFDTTGG